MDLAGRKALVTGASRGIGRATALLLAREGADVAINYASNEAAAKDVEREVRAMGRRALVLQADVGDGEQVEAMFRRIREQWGGLDVLVNNAGGRCDGPLLEVEESAWERALAVHLMGTVCCCRLALPAMIEKRDGVIVNVGFVIGRRDPCVWLPFVNLDTRRILLYAHDRSGNRQPLAAPTATDNPERSVVAAGERPAA